MYIEFHLPELPSPGRGIPFAINCIEMDIENWAKQHNIQFYKTKRHKKMYRLILKDEEAYSYFALTWNPMWAASREFNFKQPK